MPCAHLVADNEQRLGLSLHLQGDGLQACDKVDVALTPRISEKHRCPAWMVAAGEPARLNSALMRSNLRVGAATGRDLTVLADAYRAMQSTTIRSSPVCELIVFPRGSFFRIRLRDLLVRHAIAHTSIDLIEITKDLGPHLDPIVLGGGVWPLDDWMRDVP